MVDKDYFPSRPAKAVFRPALKNTPVTVLLPAAVISLPPRACGPPGLPASILKETAKGREVPRPRCGGKGNRKIACKKIKIRDRWGGFLAVYS